MFSEVATSRVPETLDEIESFATDQLTNGYINVTLDEKIKQNGLTLREVNLFKQLKRHYIYTTQALYKTCLDYDHFQMLQNNLPVGSEYAED